MMRGGSSMKAPLTKHYCINKQCGWEETNYKYMDGFKCKKCKGPIISRFIKRK